MKKIIKTIVGLVVCIALVGGGYFAGQKAQQSSIVSALPKNILDLPREKNQSENEIEGGSEVDTEAVDEKENIRIINKSDKSSAQENWSVVESSANATDNGALTLYTSAEMIDGEIIWDDTQTWVLEVSDGNGGYYTLLDKSITNGNVYFDVTESENGTRMINVYIFDGVGTTIKQYTRDDNGFSEKNVYESGQVNRVFTTIPMYE